MQTINHIGKNKETGNETAVKIVEKQNGTSFGYNAPGLLDGSKPAHPSMELSFGTRNLSGSNSLGLSQKYGDL